MRRWLTLVLLLSALSCASTKAPSKPAGLFSDESRYSWTCLGLVLLPQLPKVFKAVLPVRKLVAVDCLVWDRKAGYLFRLLVVPAPKGPVSPGA